MRCLFHRTSKRTGPSARSGWRLPAVALALAIALVPTRAAADAATIATMTGGGAGHTGGGVRLHGALFGYGLPGDHAGRSASASHRIGVGFYPPLAAQIGSNAADPAWLELTRWGNRVWTEPAAPRQPLRSAEAIVLVRLDPDRPAAVP